MMRQVDVAGAARLVLVEGAALLHPEPAVFEAMLTGWRQQQESRLLARVDDRDAGQDDAPVPGVHRRVSVAVGPRGRRGVDGVVAFGGPVAYNDPRLPELVGDVLGFVCDARYGWVDECEDRFGEHPVQICHEWNTADHVADYEGGPGRRPFTRASCRGSSITPMTRSRRAAAAWPQGWVGGVAGRRAVQGDLRVGAAPPGGDDAGHHRLLHQPGRSRAGPVRDAVGPLRQGDAGQRPPRRRNVATVMPWAVRGAGGVSGRGPSAAIAPGDRAALWLTERGGRISARQRQRPVHAPTATRSACRASSRPHCLRHSYVSHLVEDGVDPLFVQQQVGHSPRGDDRDLHLGDHRLPQPGAARGARPGLHRHRGGRAMRGRVTTYHWHLRQLMAAHGHVRHHRPGAAAGRAWRVAVARAGLPARRRHPRTAEPGDVGRAVRHLVVSPRPI